MRPDVLSVAREAGVSTATVSRVLNRSPKVSEATRAKVAEALRRLRYVPEGRASRTVAIFLESGDGLEVNAYSGRLLVRFTKSLHERNLPFEVLPASEIPRMHERSIRGAIFLGWSEASRRLWSTHLPEYGVMVNDHVKNGVTVATDHAAQAGLATRRLVDGGHRRIALLTDRLDNWGGRQRIEGFRKEMKEHDLPIRETWIRESRGADPAGVLSSLLAEGVTALVLCGEDILLPSFHALHQAGVDVPGDLSLVALENAWVSPWLTPGPTSIDSRTDELAEVAASRLLAFFEGKADRRDALIAPLLVERDSVVAPRRRSAPPRP